MNNAREHRDKAESNKPKRGGGSFKTKQRRFQRKMSKKYGEHWYRLTYTDYRYSSAYVNTTNFNQHELP